MAGNDRDRQEKILRERAASLAATTSSAEPAGSSNDSIEVLVFQVAGERYAFETAYIGKVCPMLPVTYIPGVPDYVVGIIAVYGDVLSVIDLRSLLDLPLSGLAEPEAIVVLRGESMEFGILAEAILGLERYPLESLQPNLPTLANIEKTYLKGVATDRTAVLDAVQLLSDARLVVDID
ncbi:hypothetical protein ASE07_25445 [Noviherbaspirillum sp. Root189]|nr:hypothetical protein ASE07_25445 [Noviherbaspirillum sp. Root189]